MYSFLFIKFMKFDYDRATHSLTIEKKRIQTVLKHYKFLIEYITVENSYEMNKLISDHYQKFGEFTHGLQIENWNSSIFQLK